MKGQGKHVVQCHVQHPKLDRPCDTSEAKSDGGDESGLISARQPGRVQPCQFFGSTDNLIHLDSSIP